MTTAALTAKLLIRHSCDDNSSSAYKDSTNALIQHTLPRTPITTKQRMTVGKVEAFFGDRDCGDVFA